MTFLIRKSLLTLTLGSCLVVITEISAKASTQFVCEKNNNVPTTTAQTPRGDIPIIRWTSDYFSKDGYTPQVRCQEVSARFQNYYDNGSLKYLTTGLINGIPVICTSDRIDGGCQNLLFTLKEGTNPSEALRDLFNVRDRARGPLNETKNRTYIDVEKLLNTSTTPSTEQNTKTKPVKERTAW